MSMSQAAGAERLALVIGSADYDSSGSVNPEWSRRTDDPGRTRFLSDLANPRSDAELVAARLEAEGFEVRLEFDLGREALESALRDFSQALAAAGPDTQGVLYYAGHGVQIENRQFLVPAGATITREPEPSYFEADRITADLVAIDTFEYPEHLSQDGWVLVILDACRENPWPSLAARGILAPAGGGQGPLEYLPVFGSGHPSIAERGLLLLAAEPGALAKDGDFDNSPVARALDRALAGRMKTTGQLEAAVIDVRREVYEETAGYQLPHLYRGAGLLPCGEDCERAFGAALPGVPNPALEAARAALRQVAIARIEAADGARARLAADEAAPGRSEILLDEFPPPQDEPVRLDIWEYYQEGGLYASFTGEAGPAPAGVWQRRCSLVFLRARCPVDHVAAVAGRRGFAGGWRGSLHDLVSGDRALGEADMEAAPGEALRFNADGSYELGRFAQGRLVAGAYWPGARDCPVLVFEALREPLAGCNAALASPVANGLFAPAEP